MEHIYEGYSRLGPVYTDAATFHNVLKETVRGLTRRYEDISQLFSVEQLKSMAPHDYNHLASNDTDRVHIWYICVTIDNTITVG